MNYTNVLISGNSSGIGLELTNAFLKQGTHVFGCSRRGYPLNHANLNDVICDLGDLDNIPSAMKRLLSPAKHLDLVVLNAGILGKIQSLKNTTIEDIENMMRINVWSNKVIIDWLFDNNIQCTQIVLMSSGAAVNGNKGWGAYSLSKATLNMLTKLYAPEWTNTHFSALAPGLVDTAMQDYLCDPEQSDAENFPSLKRLRAARGSTDMPSPDIAAQKLMASFPKLLEQESGCFIDIREF